MPPPKPTKKPLSLTTSEWGNTREKPLFSPSKLRDFHCGLRFKLRWVEHVGVKGTIAVIPTLGTLVHSVEAAIDLGKDPESAIKGTLQQISSQTHIQSSATLLQQLAEEVRSIVLGKLFTDGKGTPKRPEKYSDWVKRQQKETPWEVFLVERRLYADVGPLILAPKLDLAIETTEGLFAVERKTKSSISDDAKWANKFRLNDQILSQVLALQENFPQKRVVGAMVRAVPYSRQNSKDWTSDLPQGLSNVRRKDPLWFRRSPTTEALFLDLLVNVRREYERRLEKNSYPAEGLANGMCEFCDYQKFCRGEIPARALVPIAKDEITLEEERRQAQLVVEKIPPPTRKSRIKPKTIEVSSPPKET